LAAERLAANPNEIHNLLSDKPSGVYTKDGKQVLDLRPEDEE